MKSLFEDEEADPSFWTDLLMEKVDKDSVVYLRNQDREYQEIGRKKKEIQDNFPCIEKLMDDDGAVEISAEEHKKFLEFLALRSDMEYRERELHYWYGHVHCYEYLKRIGAFRYENE